MSLKFTPFILLCSFVFILASCGKEKSVDTLGVTPGGTNGNGNDGGSSNGSEIGTWKFIDLKAKNTSIIEMSGLGMSSKTETLNDYTTENNAGTCEFDGSTMTGTGLEFTVNTMTKTYIYNGGALEDSIELPMNYIAPPTNSSSTYKKFGTDSIYVNGGTLQTPNGTQQSNGTGFKLRWYGDKMTLTGRFSQSSSQLIQGVMQRTSYSLYLVYTFQKQ
ncbi:hypothetical protein [Niastella populi]|uniref:Lipocalin-like domain-containing protein n=1 Tax=Niastella populi TaxID=550983 RepID=A0A1V9EGJ2_9BACT|nr:hypothetical protein [Niastella populi]OQP45250.1 hypothetical protein A4R26_32390 [Niastella populi]